MLEKRGMNELCDVFMRGKYLPTFLFMNVKGDSFNHRVAFDDEKRASED